MADTDCLFCKIVAGDIPADVVLDNEACVAFRDIDPKAPTHVVVVPRATTRTWPPSPPPTRG